MVNKHKLKKEFIEMGFTPSCLSEFWAALFPEPPISDKMVDFTVEPISLGRGIYSRFYYLLLKAGEKEVELLAKEPLGDTALHDWFRSNGNGFDIAPAVYESDFFQYIGFPSKLHRTPSRDFLIMPYYRNPSLDNLLLEGGAPGKKPDGVQPEDLLHQLLVLSLKLAKYPTRDRQGKLTVKRDTTNRIEDKITKYLGALLVFRKYPSQDNLKPLILAGEAADLSSKVRYDLGPVVNLLSQGATVTHGDCRPENILKMDSAGNHAKYQLIDWGNARLGPPNLDFVTLFNSQEFGLLGISDSSGGVEMLFRAMATNRRIRAPGYYIEHFIAHPDQIEHYVGEEERPEIMKDYTYLRVWDSLKRAGLDALFAINYPQEYERFLLWKGKHAEYYKVENTINYYLGQLLRICEEYEKGDTIFRHEGRAVHFYGLMDVVQGLMGQPPYSNGPPTKNNHGYPPEHSPRLLASAR